MTQPDGANPSGAHNPTHPGSFLEWQNLTEAAIFDKSKAPIVGTTGSATQAQKDIAATDGNVIPSGGGLWQAFTRNADATFPRIMLEPLPESTSSGGGHSCSDSAHSHAGHSHGINMSAPPDFQPDGHGGNYVQLGFIECSKDRRYSRITFGTGNSVTALGINAMYAGAYLMDDSTGDLQLMASTADIKADVASTNREYTFNITTTDALKSEIWAVGVLQVTQAGQTCKSLLAKPLWAMTAPAGFKPAALYAISAGGQSVLPTTIAYSSMEFGASKVPYFALS